MVGEAEMQVGKPAFSQAGYTHAGSPLNTLTDSSVLLTASHDSSPAYVNNEHCSKAKLRMRVTLLGIYTDVSAVQPENAYEAINVTPTGIDRLVNRSQSRNAKQGELVSIVGERQP